MRYQPLPQPYEGKHPRLYRCELVPKTVHVTEGKSAPCVGEEFFALPRGENSDWVDCWRHKEAGGLEWLLQYQSGKPVYSRPHFALRRALFDTCFQTV